MGAGPSWKKDEIEFLKQNWINMTDNELSISLNRSIGSVVCKRKRIGLLRSTRKYAYEDVVKEFLKTDYELLSGPEDYFDAAQNTIKYICPRHRDKGIMTISLGHLQSGRGCYYCGREKTENAHKVDLSDPRYKKLCDSKNLEYVETKRKDGKIVVGFICPQHKEEGIQYAQYWNLQREGNGCLFCHRSKWEESIRILLRNMNIVYEIEKIIKLDNSFIRLDFYLPEYNKAIEYDGIHHFKPFYFNGINKETAEAEYNNTVYRDKLKDCYCEENNIELLRIPYYDFENSEQLIKDFVFK